MICTANDTRKTSSEMRNPDFDTFMNLVLSPIAVRAMIIENLGLFKKMMLWEKYMIFEGARTC